MDSGNGLPKARHRATALAIVANTIFCAAAIFFAAALAWAFRRAALYPPGAMHSYYVFFVAGVALCLGALALRVDLRAKVALAVLSAIASLYVVEIGLTLMRPTGNAHTHAAAERGLEFDSRSKADFVDDLRQSGKDAHPLIPPIFLAATNGLESPDGDRLYPLGNISRALVVDCNEAGTYSVFEADEHGFDNPLGTFDLDAVDVALVGDSFGIGSCVEPEEDIGGRLRRKGLRVLNLSNASNGPLLELASLVEYGTRMRPRVVFWLFFEGNDPSDLLLEQRSSILLRYLEQGFSQDLLGRQEDVDRALEAYVRERAGRSPKKGPLSVPIAIGKLTALRQRVGLELPALAMSPHFRDILERAAQETAAWGGELHFVYLPDWTRYGGRVRDNLVHRDRVLEIARELRIPIIDLDRAFREHPDPFSLFALRVRGHYSSDGYALVSKELMKVLGGPTQRSADSTTE